MNVRQVRVRQLVRNRVNRGHEGKVKPDPWSFYPHPHGSPGRHGKRTRLIPDGWAYQAMVRLTSWIPSLAMYLAVRTPVPQMT
jgi:hypothetical protein